MTSLFLWQLPRLGSHSRRYFQPTQAAALLHARLRLHPVPAPERCGDARLHPPARHGAEGAAWREARAAGCRGADASEPVPCLRVRARRAYVVHCFPQRARCCAGSRGACARRGRAVGMAACAGLLASFVVRRCSVAVGAASELAAPTLRQARSRLFLVVRAALERCGACLCVSAARRGSFGLGASVRTPPSDTRSADAALPGASGGWGLPLHWRFRGSARAVALGLGALAPVGGGLGACPARPC
jgi:hypothetical protein